VPALNELEYVKGEIFANVWQTSASRHLPLDGRVTSWIDLHGLLDPRERQATTCSTGSPTTPGDRLFVTGKLWPRIFEIQVVRR
jgi:glutamine cyclotransferase